MESNFKEKVIAVTGGTGTVGAELVEQLLALKPKQIRVLSRDDSKQHSLLETLNHPQNLRLLIGDVRDYQRLQLAFENVEVVFHAAALKHVPLAEYNPFEAVKTNIIGSQHVIEAALENKVKKVIAISTDKAVNPTNIMGVSKLMMEKMFINVNYFMSSSGTSLACVRFGNVAWARGSVLTVWQRQAKRDGTITVTDGGMTRFLMSNTQAVSLILKAAELSRGGEIFILKMPAIKLIDLAHDFIAKYYPNKNIKIKEIGIRPGEKSHEELFDIGDTGKTIYENNEMFIISPPAMEIYDAPALDHSTFYQKHGFKKIENPAQKSWSSKDHLDRDKIKTII